MLFRLGRLLGPVYSVYQKRLVRNLRKGPMPHHLAVIMDGNRRFAEQLGLAPFEGHLRGRGKLEEMMEWCQELGIRVLTVYAFSTENLDRPKEELETLMDLFADAFRQVGDDPRIHGSRVRVCALGHRELLPERVRDAIAYAEEKTAHYEDYRYNIAVAYGGRQEIIQAMRQLAWKVQAGELAPDEIDIEMVSKHLYTGDLPDPDLILRTSGEERVSNFLLWQLAYSEFYFADVYWPALRKVDFLRAIRAYQQRRRRRGL